MGSLTGKPMTSPEALRSASHALFGYWAPGLLGGALSASERTVRRWGAGEFEVPAGVWRDLAKLCHERAEILLAMSKSLERGGR